MSLLKTRFSMVINTNRLSFVSVASDLLLCYAMWVELFEYQYPIQTTNKEWLHRWLSSQRLPKKKRSKRRLPSTLRCVPSIRPSIIMLLCRRCRGMLHLFAHTAVMNLTVGHMPTCVNSKCHAWTSAIWLTKVKFPVFARHHGKKNTCHYRCFLISN